MVGIGTDSSDLPNVYILASGALSGLVTRAICQPLDVVKIRLQLQVEPVCYLNKKSHYKSVKQALKLILKEEGIKAYWRGHVPAQYLSITYGLVQFSTFELFSRHCLYNLDTDYMPIGNFVGGSLAGGFATMVSFPFDVARTRLIAQKPRGDGVFPYKGVTSVILLTYRYEGFMGMYRGLLPTVLQVAPHTGVQFMVYKILDEFLLPSADSTLRSMLCGGLAGLVAKTSVYPLDLMRKRLQVQGMLRLQGSFCKNFICDGLMDCAYKLVSREGLSALYKGLSPSLLKAIAASSLHFGSYEAFCKLFRDYG